MNIRLSLQDYHDMIQGGARASEWFLPSSVESTQVLGLESCPAARLHNLNAADPRCHLARAQTPKAIRCLCTPRVHKLGPERTWGTFPKALCARESLALSPVRDCSGFVTTDHIRLLFARCQAPFCLIGSESRVPGQPGFPH